MVNVKPVKLGNRERMSFGKINEVIDMPNLIDVQKQSYQWFLDEGLKEVFKDVSGITDYQNNLVLDFIDYSIDVDHPNYSIVECKSRDATFSAALRVTARLLNRATGEIKESNVFMGDFPLMTPSGTFIINGAERVIVSQLVRSPGVYYKMDHDKTGKELYSATVIPNRGAWLEYETDINDVFYVRIDKNRKLPVTAFIRSLGLGTDAEILDFFGDDERMKATIEKDQTSSVEEGLIEVYRKLRPSEPPTVDSSQQHINNLFFDPGRYDMSRVGRYKYNKKLGIADRLEGQVISEPISNPRTGEVMAFRDEKITKEKALEIENAGVQIAYVKAQDEKIVKVISNGMVDIKAYVDFDAEAECGIRENVRFDVLCEILDAAQNEEELKEMLTDRADELTPNHITKDDIFATINYLNCVAHGVGRTDDIDHLGNRRIRCVGELLQNQVRIGFSRLDRVVRERMATQSQDMDSLSPNSLINIRPVTAAIREFFGSSPLSQFMDQTNPLAELTHKRRLSALGPGGLSRDRAGFEVRDVHYTHYGRMCPIETPEGPNIGLISYLTSFARINKYGFIESPYRKINKETGVVTNEVVYMTADVEDNYTVAQANEPLDENGRFVHTRVVGRRRDEFVDLPADEFDFMDVSPKQVLSVATAMIPFLENDDANRALMGANMQRQAVPLLRTEAPIVGTGMEYKAGTDSGVCILAEEDGVVLSVDARNIRVQYDSGRIQDFEVIKFLRSNQGTCINQRPIVERGQRVKKGEVLADGPATDHGEVAIGKNALIGFMTWEGYNYEDAVLLNEKIVRDDVYTSIHIEEYDTEARDTKLGPEEITRDIPNVGEDMLKYLDEDGIVQVGAEVHAGDILVGKVTPKGETELTAEERLLRAIFGEKAREVRDTSLRVPHGESGTVVDVKVFTRADSRNELQPGVNKVVRVYLALKRKISVGDKMAGRHGNKGVVSRILPVEDMPFLPDGTPLDIVLNPLGVPSRMNIGQVLETHLGWAVQGLGMKIKATDLHIQNVLKEARTDASYWEQIDAIRGLYAEIEELEAKAKEDVTVPHFDIDEKIIDLKSQILGHVESAAQKKLEALGGEARYQELKAIEAKYNALHVEFFDSEEDAPEMDPALVEELEAINKVKTTLNHIESARAKRVEIRQELEGLGYDYETYGMPKPDVAGIHIATPVFDGAHEKDVFETLGIAGRSDDGKTVLYDGRTGEPMDNRVTVGYVYMLKLHHLVDDKIHARSTGPYSLVTQQPLGGKAQFGGQRFGEMEVWALEAYGAAYTLQELLTVKSDDVVGRVKAYEKIVKGENIPEPGVPESFKVLLKELQSIGLDVKILNEDQEEVVMKELEDEDEVVETGIEEVMEGSAVETDEVTVVEPEVEEEEDLPADNGGEDDILSQLAYPMGDSSNDED